MACCPVDLCAVDSETTVHVQFSLPKPKDGGTVIIALQFGICIRYTIILGLTNTLVIFVITADLIVLSVLICLVMYRE